MPTDTKTARDEMLSLFKTAIEASAHSGLQIYYNDQHKPDPKLKDTSWARASVQHSTGRQASLTSPGGNQRWEQTGFFVVQLFTPGLTGQTTADEIVDIILNAFRGQRTAGGVTFRNPRFNEVGQSGPWMQTNVLVDFEYDTIR